MTALAAGKHFVSLAEPRILRAQLELLLRNSTSSTVPAITLALLLCFTLGTPGHEQALFIWCGAVFVWRLFSTWEVTRLVKSPSAFERTRRTILWLMVINGVDMVIWAALAWLTLSTSSLAGSVLVIAVLSAIASNSLSTLSPVLPIFVTTLLTEFSIVVAKVWQIGDPAYHALGIAGVLYTFTLMNHALNSYNTVRTSIELRFEREQLIEQLHEKTSKAESAQHAAEQANLEKSRFLAAASHDLRQPVQAQGLLLEVLSDPRIEAEKQLSALSAAKSAWRASTEMLDKLLDLSRIEAGVLVPEIRSFRLQPLLHQMEVEMAHLADAKVIAYRTRDTALAVQSDPALLEIILRNLVSNAIRYTRSGGVLVSARRRKERVLLEVWDTGTGIPENQLEDIFREFYQLGNPERDRRKGLGLGLAIVKRLSDALQYDIEVRSRVMRGSRFRLSLPIALGAVLDDLPLRAAVAAPSEFSPLNLHVLISDDEELVRTSLSQLLGLWACTCAEFDSLEEAWSVARDRRPDLIICDYRLRKNQTGDDAIRQLRQFWGFEIPALLLTGDTGREKLRAASVSALPLLHKPVTPTTLFQHISRLVGR